MSADELKAAGNKAITEKNFDEAIDKFTQAIALQPENHILYSNRSAAYASKKDWEHALEDAEKTTQLKPDWSKGWGRKGAALHGKGDLAEASAAYEEGLKFDGNNAQLKSGLASAQKALEQDSGFGLGKMFSDPQLLAKLAANPKTSAYLADPSFMAKLQDLRTNPGASANMLEDPRMMTVLGVMMGVDISMGGPGSAEAATAASAAMAESEDVSMPDLASESSRPTTATSKPAPVKQPEPEPEPEAEPEVEEAAEKAKAKEAAEAEKRRGTEEYKHRNFDAAIAHYSKAWELHNDITYLNNLGAAYFEKGDLDACIESCQKAIEEGRQVFADFKVIGKAYTRIGTAYDKKGDLDHAIENFKRALTEHRTPDTLNKLRSAERRKTEAARTAYIDPAKAEEAREEGNRKFKESDWPGAVAAYTEMIKRAPDDSRGYSNRAAVFTKLFEFPSALEDCETAIKKDPKFIRAYIRKAQVYFGMRKYSECVDACAEAQRIDVEHHGGANAREIESQQQKAFAAMYASRDSESEDQTRERLMRDPEIMGIMQDPIMNSILQQAQSDPAALSEHMKNPRVRTKIQKLIAAGVIRVGR